MTLLHTPAEILKQHLVAGGHLQLMTTQGADWPTQVGKMSETPDQQVTLYDTAGQLDGKLFTNGETQEHFGFQIRLRSMKDYSKGFLKMQALKGALDSVRQSEVTMAGNTKYLLHAAIVKSPILHLGQEETKPRDIFTINGLLSLSEV